jgi:hypothetical protein
MYLVINKCVKAVTVSNFSGHYLHNRSTLDIGVLGYITILYHEEHPPKVWHIPPGTPCVCVYIYIYMCVCVCVCIYMQKKNKAFRRKGVLCIHLSDVLLLEQILGKIQFNLIF